MPYITHGFLRADSRNSMGFILLYGKKNVSRCGFRHSVLEVTRRLVCHVILQRCAGRDMLDDAAAEAQLAEADELLTAVLFVPYGWKVLPLSCDREGFCRILFTHPEKDGMINWI